MPKSAVSTGPPPGASSRDRILSVAKRLFASRGYEHASTSAIARMAGTSESQLMKHFGSKQGLLEALFTAGWTELTEQARRDIALLTAPEEKLRAIAYAALRMLERDTEFKQLVLLEGRRLRKDGPAIGFTEGFLSFVRLLDGVFYELEVAGRLRPGVHPHAARSAVMGAFEGLVRDHYLAQKSGYPAAYELSAVPQVLGVLFDAFTASAAQSAPCGRGSATNRDTEPRP